MSIEARKALVQNPKLSSKGYMHVVGSHLTDLLSTSETDTYLIAMLQWMCDHCPEPIELIAIRTDHPTEDQPWLHSGGKAIDCYPKNWEGREQEAVCAVLKAFADNPYCENVGLGGIVQGWRTWVTWPATQYFWLFDDNPQDHIHAGSACQNDTVGGARAAAA